MIEWVGKHLPDLSFILVGAWVTIHVATRVSKAIIPWKELIVDPKTGMLDYKMMMMVVCALLQSITWLRLSFGYKVDSSLDSPALWITFYSVIAGHDILGKVIEVWNNNKTNNSAKVDTDASNNQ